MGWREFKSIESYQLVLRSLLSMRFWPRCNWWRLPWHMQQRQHCGNLATSKRESEREGECVCECVWVCVCVSVCVCECECVSESERKKSTKTSSHSHSGQIKWGGQEKKWIPTTTMTITIGVWEFSQKNYFVTAHSNQQTITNETRTGKLVSNIIFFRWNLNARYKKYLLDKFCPITKIFARYKKYLALYYWLFAR